MEDESGTDGRSSFKSIIHQPLSWTKTIRSPSAFISTCWLVWKPGCVVWELLHKAPPLHSRPAPYALVHWDKSESTISKHLCKHWHTLFSQMFEEKWKKTYSVCGQTSSLRLCVPHSPTINRGAGTACLALPEQHKPFVSLQCDALTVQISQVNWALWISNIELHRRRKVDQEKKCFSPSPGKADGCGS